MKTKIKTEMQLVEDAVNSETKGKAAQLETLLDGAKSHPEIEAAMPKCKDFFKSLTSDEFVELLNNKSNSDSIYIALWYHYGETMHKAVNKCALAGKKRMMLLYPLWRLYSDESDTYI